MNPFTYSFQMPRPSKKTRQTPSLAALSRPVTRAVFRVAIAGLSHFAVRANAGLRVHAPEQAIVAGRHRWIRLRKNKLAFPAQRRTQVRIIRIEALRLRPHAAPPEAFIIARVSATFVSLTLYSLWLSGEALANAASAAF